MQASILFITRSILIIIIASKMILFVVGASVNHFSRRLGGIVRLRSSTEIFAKSNMEFSDVGGSRNNYFSGINSAFVTCFRGTKLSSFRVRHYSQVLPISASARAAVPTEYSHSVLINELNDSQKEATLRPRYSITRVIAGPGAGKTKVLTCRIAHLLLDNDDYNREGILAVTFTKKAAMEMESRLTDLLSSLVSESSNDDQMADDPALEQGEFVQYGNADPSGENNLDNAYARSLLRQATVGTFHSVCSKILRKFGKELGELPSVRQCIGVMNLSGAQLAQEGIQTLISGEQSTVVTLTLDGSFNILDQSDQLRLLKDVLKEHNIELSSPVASSQRNGDDIRPITVLNAISLMNTEEAISITQGGRKEGDTESSKMSKKVRQIATQIRTPFQKAKYTQNSVDFDDLILLSRELLLQHEDIREVLHSRWRHILVDEFQDTSQVQLDLVRLLTTNSLFVVGDGDQSIYSWRGASPESMTLDFELAFHNRKHGWEGLLKHDVGLTKYLERICGGDSSVADSTTLEVKSVYLMENYRSTTNIVRAAQRIISSSESINRNSAQDSIRRDMKPMRGEGPSPRVLACKDGKSEANFVVNTINSMVESDDLTPSSTVAIIYRTNAQSRLLEEACVEHNLRYVVRGSSGTFYKRAEIQDCMSFMKIMYNARDRSAWARAVKAPSRGIGEASLQEFFSYCDAIAAKYLDAQINGSPPTPLDVLVSLIPRGDGDKGELDILIPPSSCMSTRSLNRFISFASSVKSLKEKSHVLSVSQFLMSVIDDLNLRSHFDSMSKTREEYDDRLANVMELVRAANRYDDKGPSLLTGEQELESPLGNFLDDVALIADIAPDESEDGNGRIVANLMTIHSSKGMEFDAVL
jgi:DNA helicase-2/ATP-dependent DNA helicase PcrA